MRERERERQGVIRERERKRESELFVIRDGETPADSFTIFVVKGRLCGVVCSISVSCSGLHK